MLLWLASFLSDYWDHSFKVVHYLTLRSILSALTALLLTLILGPKLIIKLNNLQMRQPIRDDGPQSHLQKSQTPTMGGLLILAVIIITTLLWGDLRNTQLWSVLFIAAGFGLIGGYDDYKKIIAHSSAGLRARTKFIAQLALSLVIASLLYYYGNTEAYSKVLLPFTKYYTIPIGVLFIPFASIVIVGSSNAVNLTDGLDGLAIMPTVLVAAGLAVFVYVSGHANFASYLNIPFLPGVGEIVVVCAAIVGSGLGFLWFNTYPAQIFMGDVGALSLGAILGIIAVLVRQELVLFIMGGVFVAEALSVIIQVLYYKMTHKRIFLMSPLHHHFELKGWPEPKIIVRFWIITFILVLIGLATLKIR